MRSTSPFLLAIHITVDRSRMTDTHIGSWVLDPNDSYTAQKTKWVGGFSTLGNSRLCLLSIYPIWTNCVVFLFFNKHIDYLKINMSLYFSTTHWLLGISLDYEHSALAICCVCVSRIKRLFVFISAFCSMIHQITTNLCFKEASIRLFATYLSLSSNLNSSNVMGYGTKLLNCQCHSFLVYVASCSFLFVRQWQALLSSKQKPHVFRKLDQNERLSFVGSTSKQALQDPPLPCSVLVVSCHASLRTSGIRVKILL